MKRRAGVLGVVASLAFVVLAAVRVLDILGVVGR